eukprot:scaffold89502_cov21-Tisochrysis_lutea.AAC.1
MFDTASQAALVRSQMHTMFDMLILGLTVVHPHSCVRFLCLLHLQQQTQRQNFMTAHVFTMLAEEGEKCGAVRIATTLAARAACVRTPPACQCTSMHHVGAGSPTLMQTRLHGGQCLHSSGPHSNLHGVGGGAPHVLAPILEGKPPGAIAMAATPPGQNVADISKLSLQQLQQQQLQLQQHEQRGDSNQLQGDSRRDSVDSDAEAGAAWKWRFARRCGYCWRVTLLAIVVVVGMLSYRAEVQAFLNSEGMIRHMSTDYLRQ